MAIARRTSLGPIAIELAPLLELLTGSKAEPADPAVEPAANPMVDALRRAGAVLHVRRVSGRTLAKWDREDQGLRAKVAKLSRDWRKQNDLPEGTAPEADELYEAHARTVFVECFERLEGFGPEVETDAEQAWEALYDFAPTLAALMATFIGTEQRATAPES